MTDLVYLDTETTGLDPDRHEVWEIAYAVNDGPITSLYVPHSLVTADPKALELNGYDTRWPNPADTVFSTTADASVRAVLEGNTLVGANPAFDAAFLRRRWGVAPWHYRMVDIETLAMPILDYDRPKGLHTIVEDLRARGYVIPENDHTAAGDVAATRAAHRALNEINRTRLGRESAKVAALPAPRFPVEPVRFTGSSWVRP